MPCSMVSTLCSGNQPALVAGARIPVAQSGWEETGQRAGGSGVDGAQKIRDAGGRVSVELRCNLKRRSRARAPGNPVAQSKAVPRSGAAAAAHGSSSVGGCTQAGGATSWRRSDAIAGAGAHSSFGRVSMGEGRSARMGSRREESARAAALGAAARTRTRTGAAAAAQLGNAAAEAAGGRAQGLARAALGVGWGEWRAGVSVASSGALVAGL